MIPTKVTKEEMLSVWKRLGSLDIALQTMGHYMAQVWTDKEMEAGKAIGLLIERADDVDRLVKAAKEYIEAVDCADKVPAEKYVRRVRNGQQGLLVKIEEAIRYLRHVQGWSTHGPADINAEVLADELTEALGLLWAMLKEPTDEEREKMLDIFNRMERISQGVYSNIAPNYPSIAEEYRPTLDKLRALIMAPKRTVTREWITTFELDMRCLFGLGPRRSFIERKLAELGINIDRGDVPIINEEGNSNEEKP